MKPLDALAIMAHPDDAEITCGGLLIRLAQSGYRTGILDLTRGELGTRGSARIRAKEAAAAAKILGLAVRENARLPDGRLAPTDESRATVASILRRLRPKMVILPPAGQRHPDHDAAGEIGYAAIFAAGLAKFRVDGAAHRPEKILYAVTGQERTPAGYERAASFYVDIGDQLQTKLSAVAAYRSQFGGLQDATFATIDAMARVAGARCGVRYAEGYALRQAQLVSDPIRELRLAPV